MHQDLETLFFRFLERRYDISYSQRFQDLFGLFANRFKRRGYFIEFGALNGIDFSNTYLLERLGWKGIACEPHPDFAEVLKRNRKCELSTKCVHARTGETVQFRTYQGRPAASTFVPDDVRDENAKYTDHDIPTISLTDLLDEKGAPAVIDFLSIDTEGSELMILEAFDFSKYRFNAISVEHNYTEDRDKLLALLSKHGYRRVWPKTSGHDDWYVHSSVADDIALFSLGGVMEQAARLSHMIHDVQIGRRALMLADMEGERGDISRARAVLESARAGGVDLPALTGRLANVMQRQGDYYALSRAFSEDEVAQSPRLQEIVAQAAAMVGDFPRAEALLAALGEDLAPTNRLALNRAEIARRAGAGESAAKQAFLRGERRPLAGQHESAQAPATDAPSAAAPKGALRRIKHQALTMIGAREATPPAPPQRQQTPDAIRRGQSPVETLPVLDSGAIRDRLWRDELSVFQARGAEEQTLAPFDLHDTHGLAGAQLTGFAKGRKNPAPAREAHFARWATANGKGIALDRRGRILPGSNLREFHAYPAALGQYDLDIPDDIEITDFIADPTVMLIGSWPLHFGHWLYDHVARLVTIRDALGGYDGLKIAVGYGTRRGGWVKPDGYHAESLAALGIGIENVIPMAEDRWYGFDKLILPGEVNNFRPPMGAIWNHAEMFDVFHDMARNMGVERRTPGRRLYLSRLDTTYRICVNEQAVADLAVESGFENASLAGMSLKEQAQVMSDAEIVVGPVGNNLGALCFMQKGSTLVILFPPGLAHAMAYYQSYCDHLGIRLIGITADKSWYEPGAAQNNQSWSVDLADVKQVLGTL